MRSRVDAIDSMCFELNRLVGAILDESEHIVKRPKKNHPQTPRHTSHRKTHRQIRPHLARTPRTTHPRNPSRPRKTQ